MSAGKKCLVANCSKPTHMDKQFCLDHFKEQEGYTYGLDADIKKKLEAKWDPQKAAQAQAWLEALSGVRATGTLYDYLRNGVILCTAVNKIQPNVVARINTTTMPFKERENIANYLQACKTLGCRETDLFMTEDLYNNSNLGVVVDNIHALGGLAKKVGFTGPALGVKFADENKRQFTEEQLRANVPSRQTVGSYGYQDETANPVLARQIIKDVSGHKASEGATKLTQGSYGYQVERSAGLDKIIKNPELLEANKGANANANVSVAASETSGVSFCNQCGTQRTGAARFCSSCGTAF